MGYYYILQGVKAHQNRPCGYFIVGQSTYLEDLLATMRFKKLKAAG